MESESERERASGVARGGQSAPGGTFIGVALSDLEKDCEKMFLHCIKVCNHTAIVHKF